MKEKGLPLVVFLLSHVISAILDRQATSPQKPKDVVIETNSEKVLPFDQCSCIKMKEEEGPCMLAVGRHFFSLSTTQLCDLSDLRPH
jgi:hypothetical protein